MKDVKELISEIKKKLEVVRRDNAFRGVITHGYPTEINDIEQLLNDLEETTSQ